MWQICASFTRFHLNLFDNWLQNGYSRKVLLGNAIVLLKRLFLAIYFLYSDIYTREFHLNCFVIWHS